MVSDAATIDVSDEFTDFVVRVKVAVVEPAGTSTVAGAVILPGTPTVTLTNQPPAGAGDRSVMVPVDVNPPFTEVGFIEKPAMESPLTVKSADLLVTPSFP